MLSRVKRGSGLGLSRPVLSFLLLLVAWVKVGIGEILC